MVEDDGDQILEAILVRFRVKANHQRMFEIDFQMRLAFRRRLAGDFENAAHLRADGVVREDEAGWGFGQARGFADALDLAFEHFGHALEERLVALSLGLTLRLRVRFPALFRGVVRVQVQLASGDVLELVALELVGERHPPLVDSVREQQHFDAALAEHLQMRAVAGSGIRLRDQVVDLAALGRRRRILRRGIFFRAFGFLARAPRRHAADVVAQRGALRRRRVVGGREPQQAKESVLVGEVLADALFQHLAELVPERAVGVRIELREHVQGALRQSVLDGANPVVLLEHLAGDVERQVAAIDDAAHEAQIQGQKLLGVVHDEDALHVELEAARPLAVPQVEGRPLGNVQQAGVFQLALHPVVAPSGGILEVVGDVLVELLVLVLADVVAGPRPERLGGIDGLQFRLAATPLPFLLTFLFPVPLLRHQHRHAHVVGVAAHHRPQAEAVRELDRVRLQVQRDAGAARRVVDGLDGELVLARGGPARCRVFASAPRHHFDFLGDDEGAVEANAELADQGAVLALIAGELREELLGAGLGDGAEIRNRLLAAHADAVVLHRDHARVLVERDADAELRIVGDQRFVVQRFEAQPIDGVRGVGNQLAQKDLPIRVEGVDHQLEQLAGFGLEAKRLGGLGHGGWRFRVDGGLGRLGSARRRAIKSSSTPLFCSIGHLGLIGQPRSLRPSRC